MAPTFSVGCRVIIVNQSASRITKKREYIDSHGVIVDIMQCTVKLYLVHIDGYPKPCFNFDAADLIYEASSLIPESRKRDRSEMN